MIRAARAFGRLRAAHRALVVETVVALAVGRLLVVLVPFRHLAPRLGTQGVESSEAAPQARDAAAIRAVSWMVQLASPRLPWRCACLEQALAARLMLRRRGVASTLYLGVARDHQQGRAATAHAWLRSGPHLLTGAAGRERFSVIARYADSGT